MHSMLFPVVKAKEDVGETKAGNKTAEKPCCHAVKKTQCSVYESPHKNFEYEVVHVDAGSIEQGIRTARHAISKNLFSIQDTSDRVSNFINTGIEHTKSSYAYLTDDSTTVPRVIAITVGGFSGLVLAARRGFIRKLIYGGGSALIVAAICYPKEASKISKSAVHRIKTDGFDFVEQYTGYNPKDLTQKLPELPSTASFSSILERFNQQIKTGEKSEVKGDHGQSNPDDKHMYTTRGN